MADSCTPDLLPTSAEGCLFSGLDALCGGGDALLAGLHGAHRQMGARHSVWLGRAGSGIAICDERGARRVEELPDGVPARWIHRSPGGPLRLIGPDWLRRDPRARALSIDWGLVARSEQSGGLVWFGASRPLEASESWTHSLIRALALLDQLDQSRVLEAQRARLVEMGEQAAGVAHDLRNQLSLTKLEFDSVVLREGLTLERASAALDQALDLCRSFLTEAGDSEHEALALAPHLRAQIQESVQLSGRQGEVRVVLRCAPELSAVFDPPLLNRYLRNLLLNALAATPRGAVVRVEAQREANGRIQLTVADEGRGMERADLERLLHAGETRGGTGFGTTSVLDCAERMAADLDVESKPAAGTRFCLSLAGA